MSTSPAKDEDVAKYNSYDLIDNFLHRILSDISLFRPFVFSLSENHNDLSQWRAYSHDGIGFCIGFNKERLQNISTLINIGKCIYDPEVKKKKVNDFLDNIQSNNKFASEHIAELILSMPFTKHESFIAENEWRLYGLPINDSQIKFREGKSMVIPYLELPIKDNNGKLPISRIIIGPTPHPELSKHSIDVLLKSKGIDYVKVDYSEIPYRPL